MLDPVFKHLLRVASGFQRIEKEGDPNVTWTFKYGQICLETKLCSCSPILRYCGRGHWPILLYRTDIFSCITIGQERYYSLNLNGSPQPVRNN